ncbi:MAG: bifunctional proline dehydrogenase/L-glutamate gamma-semialdehyde dehydrogenase PutA [Proteobacteria bacterium]|nr:bifunctional proline dehydrogenase/L-glutamate gamma-semialdehyde dehydrogenase PutA [Pseudomonadota bacterium]
MLTQSLRKALAELPLSDEKACLSGLLPLARLESGQKERARATARQWLPEIRQELRKSDPMERLIHRIRLDEKEGRALMALAEALPRIPDDATADRLIADKLEQGDWRRFMENYPDLVSKLAWFGLLFGKNVSSGDSWISRMGAAGLREAMRVAMHKLGNHFVLGATIEEALVRSRKKSHALERYSFDMLGEAARTRQDAERYFSQYKQAIAAVAGSPDAGNALSGPSISVKLSALHPRFEWAQHERLATELLPHLIELVEMAAEHHVGLTVDAEEADRLEAMLHVVEPVLSLPILKTYKGFGCAVQAYQKRAPAVLDWLYESARDRGIHIAVRLVKGAYWDREIKLAQERGQGGYPVYTRKEATDVSYLACARKLLGFRGVITPQFGTHNLHTLLALREMGGETKDYEVQRLHGMGAEVHSRMMEAGIPSCVYAPVGPHKELLSYLIRRLLENSANASFVNHLPDERITAEMLIKDPVEKWQEVEPKSHPGIPLPRAIFGERLNSSGLDLGVSQVTERLAGVLKAKRSVSWKACPIIDGVNVTGGKERLLLDPANRFHEIGACRDALQAEATRAMESLAKNYESWAEKPVAERCAPLEKLADRLETERDELFALLCYEAGKTLPDAISEVREAVDLCRYYAVQARKHFSAPIKLPGISGEENRLSWHARGVFVCISPWNFPLAIFLGQVAAALAAGNTVAIKPAEQTPLIAFKAISMLLECGLPPGCVALLPGNGVVGEALVAHPLTGGVAFTGSTQTARMINRVLATKDGPLAPLIAETGGINVMIADASALPEQVVDDVVTSAFRSAGQRCSAARLLCLQNTVADEVMEMLSGALCELEVGHPAHLSTDTGPVIDESALNALMVHEERLRKDAKFIGSGRRSEALRNGNFILPQAWEIPSAHWLKEEVFGPILHVVRFKGEDLGLVLKEINAMGYGLTGGLHTRIEATMREVEKHMQVGNLYINRSIIGAVVESQPFGGEGLSGTGFKAGGPNYLLRFATERSFSQNLTASGGDVRLLGLE